MINEKVMITCKGSGLYLVQPDNSHKIMEVNEYPPTSIRVLSARKKEC
ncbi:MAG: hypothetical protein Q8M06_09755 [Methanobacteriaceae archaeon]|nr:hypothetical protein [Methanobacteriaceae archaeon]